ncbi:MAG: thioredoxin family protein [Ferruginibacter sp.]
MVSFAVSRVYAQTGCSAPSFYSAANAVNAKHLFCLGKTSGKDKILFFTFGIWCGPCRHHLPNAIKLSKDKNLDFYVLLIEKENSDKTKKAIDYLKAIDSSMKILVLKDSSYGTTPDRKV